MMAKKGEWNSVVVKGMKREKGSFFVCSLMGTQNQTEMTKSVSIHRN
jgi:hypothetical protein